MIKGHTTHIRRNIAHDTLSSAISIANATTVPHVKTLVTLACLVPSRNNNISTRKKHHTTELTICQKKSSLFEPYAPTRSGANREYTVRSLTVEGSVKSNIHQNSGQETTTKPNTKKKHTHTDQDRQTEK